MGFGAFGVVVKAEAQRIYPSESSSTVAVKMVRIEDGNATYTEALINELKIMIHLGKHINIVNLLGACTRTILDGI